MSVFAVILAVILFLFVFTAFCSSLLYWYETPNSPCAEIPSPQLGFAACLQVFFLSLGGYFIGVFLHPVGWFWHRKATPLAPESNLDKPPLVLVHGINDNASVWLYLAYKLHKAGYRVSTFSYFSLFVPLDTIAARLDDHIHLVEASYPGHKPVFIGHSLGGIFIRRWLLTPENQHRAGGVLTLATPHGGSKVAGLAPGRLVKNILPSAELIATLKATPLAEPIPCVSLVTPTDEAVLPAASLLPPEGWKLRVTNRVSHFGILYCPRVAGLLLEELDGLGLRVQGSAPQDLSEEAIPHEKMTAEAPLTE